MWLRWNILCTIYNGSASVAKKKLYRAYLDPLSLSNVGDFSWSWILGGLYPASKRESMFTSSIKCSLKLRANERNNFQHCWANNDGSCCVRVGSSVRHLPTMLGPAVHRGKDTTHKTLETTCNVLAWPQQWWKSCANASIVALSFGDQGTNEMLGVGSNVWPQQLLTRSDMQTDTTFNIQQCCRVRLDGAW